jgi:hypothetical protein
MMGFTVGLGIALLASFAFILYQAVMLKSLSEELERNKPPF